MENQSLPSPVPPSTRKRSHRLRGCAITVGIILLVVITIAVLSSTIRPVGQVVQVITGQRLEALGPSMEPTIRNGQMIYVRAYVGSTPARGDIVVFHPPFNPQDEFVKRIIAIPGDTICISATTVTLNGNQLHEPYVAAASTGSQVAVPCLTLGADRYYVLGDNRLDSADSREFGPIMLDSIVGKVVWIFG